AGPHPREVTRPPDDPRGPGRAPPAPRRPVQRAGRAFWRPGGPALSRPGRRGARDGVLPPGEQGGGRCSGERGGGCVPSAEGRREGGGDRSRLEDPEVVAGDSPLDVLLAAQDGGDPLTHRGQPSSGGVVDRRTVPGMGGDVGG